MTTPIPARPEPAPGPWDMDPENATLVRDANGDLVADFSVYAHTDSGEVLLDDCAVNARIGAAAPDLLEALRKISAVQASEVSNPEKALRIVANLARAAIAKAEGR